MVKFNDDHKKDSRDDFIPEGTHKVKILGFNFDKDTQDREFVEVIVEDEEGRQGTARMWFTTDPAINYTFNIMRGIFVHNAPKGKKDEIRESIDKLADTTELEKACKVLIGKEAWYQVQKSDRTYQAADGTTKNSYNRNIYGYEPSPRKVSSEVEDVDISNTGPIQTKDAEGNDVEIAEF